MNRETAYVTSIPAEAREKVTETWDEGCKKEAWYHVGRKCVGKRLFGPSGSLEGEWSLRHRVRHGWQYRWDHPGELLSAEPFENGKAHGTAYGWGRSGRLLGFFTMEHGTGLDLWWQDWEDGTADLTEASYYVDGELQGFAWCFRTLDKQWWERHWRNGVLHGIEREWNFQDRLRRGCPGYWVNGERVDKRKYLRATARDPELPSFRPEENKPERAFPPEVARHLRRE